MSRTLVSSRALRRLIDCFDSGGPVQRDGSMPWPSRGLFRLRAVVPRTCGDHSWRREEGGVMKRGRDSRSEVVWNVLCRLSSQMERAGAKAPLAHGGPRTCTKYLRSNSRVSKTRIRTMASGRLDPGPSERCIEQSSTERQRGLRCKLSGPKASSDPGRRLMLDGRWSMLQ